MDNYAAEWVLSRKAEGGTKEKLYDNPDWSIKDVQPNLNGTLSFLHTCTADLSTMQIMALPGAKEFGEGFYTTGADTEIPYKLIATNWFQIKQGRWDWHVVAFALPADYLMRKLCGKNNLHLANTIRFYLEHSTGYPSGNANPTAGDLQGINAVNRANRVLIFPHNKDTQVAYGPGQETKNWSGFTEDKLGGGDYRLVIGPQQPVYMQNYRQYAWTPGWGIWLINSGIRYYRYRNYQIKKGYRVAVGIAWPKEHPTVDASGKKVK